MPRGDGDHTSSRPLSTAISRIAVVLGDDNRRGAPSQRQRAVCETIFYAFLQAFQESLTPRRVVRGDEAAGERRPERDADVRSVFGRKNERVSITLVVRPSCVRDGIDAAANNLETHESLVARKRSEQVAFWPRHRPVDHSGAFSGLEEAVVDHLRERIVGFVEEVPISRIGIFLHPQHRNDYFAARPQLPRSQRQKARPVGGGLLFECVTRLARSTPREEMPLELSSGYG